jgi:excisionase family DNA binding protein
MKHKDLSVREAAELMGVSKTTVYRLCRRGDFPNHYRRDQQIWIPRSDIDNYLQRKHQEETLKPGPPGPGPEAEPLPISQETVESAPIATPPAKELKPEPTEEVPQAEPEPPPLAEEVSPPGESELTPPPEETPSTAELTPEPPLGEPQWVKTFRHKGQRMKRFLVNTGIAGASRLEQSLRKLRDKLEQYKARTFPEIPRSQESENKADYKQD